jgi:hypothetical protein
MVHKREHVNKRFRPKPERNSGDTILISQAKRSQLQCRRLRRPPHAPGH